MITARASIRRPSSSSSSPASAAIARAPSTNSPPRRSSWSTPPRAILAAAGWVELNDAADRGPCRDSPSPTSSAAHHRPAAGCHQQLVASTPTPRPGSQQRLRRGNVTDFPLRPAASPPPANATIEAILRHSTSPWSGTRRPASRILYKIRADTSLRAQPPTAATRTRAYAMSSPRSKSPRRPPGAPTSCIVARRARGRRGGHDAVAATIEHSARGSVPILDAARSERVPRSSHSRHGSRVRGKLSDRGGQSRTWLASKTTCPRSSSPAAGCRRLEALITLHGHLGFHAPGSSCSTPTPRASSSAGACSGEHPRRRALRGAFDLVRHRSRPRRAACGPTGSRRSRSRPPAPAHRRGDTLDATTPCSWGSAPRPTSPSREHDLLQPHDVGAFAALLADLDAGHVRRMAFAGAHHVASAYRATSWR